MAQTSPSHSVTPLPPDPVDDLDPIVNDLDPIVDMDDAPLSPPPVGSEVDPQLCRTDFPAAGKTYSRGKSFVDRLNDDKFAPHRVQNPYYPFADQEEWELGSFLLRSGMLMQKVDEFLRLKLVLEFLILFLLRSLT